MERRSSRSSGRFQRHASEFGESSRVAEPNHSRSFASRLGMAEMSCFPTSRSRRAVSGRSDAYSSSQGRKDLGSSSSNNNSINSSGVNNANGGNRSIIDRGKAQEFPRSGSGASGARLGVYADDSELAKDEEEEGSSSGVTDDDKLNSDDHAGASSDQDDVFELRDSVYAGQVHQTHRSPLVVDTGGVSIRGRRRTVSRAGGAAAAAAAVSSAEAAHASVASPSRSIFNSRRVYPGSSSSSAASGSSHGPLLQRERRDRGSSSMSRKSECDELPADLELRNHRPILNSRRMNSFMNTTEARAAASVRSRQTTIPSPGPRPPSPFTRNPRFYHPDNNGSGNWVPGSARGLSRSNSQGGVRTEQENNGGGGTLATRRRNITNCFPAFGGNSSRRSSSPSLRQRLSAHAVNSSSSHSSSSSSTTTAAAASSSQGPLSMLAAALEMMPSSASYRGSSSSENNIASSASEVGWPSSSSSFGWEYHRPRLMAEGLAKVLMALERMDSDEELTHEQLLMLEATVLFGGMALHDEHRDWRLDVDSMSYEELLALGDRIGSVNTGVSDETICRRLVRSRFCARKVSSCLALRDGELKCSICQEEYAEGEDLGAIECGHKYHAGCIRQWLVQKNLCPICKATGLP